MNKRRRLLLTLAGLFVSGFLFAQKSVTGTVSDTAGNKLPSVSILIPGSNKGAVTDESGNFRINVPDNTRQLEISLVGFQQQLVDIGSNNELNVVLVPTAYGLSDVVVVGYGVQRRRDVTGTISSVKGEDLRNLPVANPASALQGRASGVDIVRSDGAPGAASTLR